MRVLTVIALLCFTVSAVANGGGGSAPSAYPLDYSLDHPLETGAVAPRAVPDKPDDVAELGARLSPMESLSARFTQTVTSADGYILQEATGTLAVERPGKVRWHSEEPFEQLVVSDAETLWLYDPDLEQVTVRPFSADIGRTPAVLFIGEVRDLARDYRVSAERQAGLVRYWLEPRGQDALYERIALDFEGQTPVAMALWDSLGQATRIGFSDVRVNAELDPAGFHFTPPPGVDILSDE